MIFSPGRVSMNDSARESRFRQPSIPPNVLPFSLVGVVLCALTVLICWAVLQFLRFTLEKNKIASGLFDVIMVLVGLIPLALFVPAIRGVREALQAQNALRNNDLINARVRTASAQSSSWFALGYGVFAVLTAIAVWFLITNDVAVGSTFFKMSLIVDKFGLVLKAFMTNVVIFCIAEVLILVWALVVAIARMIPGRAGQPIRLLATLYTDAFRGLPSIITIYLVGFGLPLTGLTDGLSSFLQDRFGIDDLTTLWAIIALTLTYGAYVAEVYRAGIESIHPSQFAAARSLGLSFTQTMRFVIVPQAVRRIIPPLLNDFIGLQKDTALVNVIGTIDAFNQSKMLASNYFNLSTVTIVAFLFVIITIPQARFVDRMLEHDAKKTRGAR
jgi:polar amino acid transport system permease protein